MPAPLSVHEVERIAALAHLELTAEEKHLFAKQLADIIEYAEQVRRVDTSGVPATAHVHAPRRGPDPATSAERADEPRPSLSVEEALANAPDADRHAGLFKVPRVIGG